ncbi:MAG: nitroreductase family deazaflavin-dependent oxidoreductase [Frankiaceae bacterium]|nr:nitroreductase family deazaflavin-dependent oxidoreductase [Frankiaceae bacterium]MBV9871305.1 nitroreductase family deazaflavin-dependent oxidoreductase [Frankiaceae bacterium]
MSDAHYKKPDWFTKHVFNKVVAGFTRLGLSVWGSRILEVKGRTTGEPRHTPVNLLTVGDAQYLVAPRGETQWVRNLRVAGDGVLILGRRRQPFTAAELPVTKRAAILRPYLKRWKAEVGVFFDGVSAESPDSELERIAPNHPVFRITSG